MGEHQVDLAVAVALAQGLFQGAQRQHTAGVNALLHLTQPVLGEHGRDR